LASSIFYTKNARIAAVEIYKLPQGKIIICFSDKNLSIGLLELNPKQKLPRHNRPVAEELLKISGTCKIRLFDEGNMVKEIALAEYGSLEIPANQFHIHVNPTTQRSLTLWKFRGDITKILDEIRENFERI
jgi:quercetin dioxygenase-like cupin family protein